MHRGQELKNEFPYLSLRKKRLFSLKNEDFFWNEKRLRSGIFPLQRQTKQGGLLKLVKGTHC